MKKIIIFFVFLNILILLFLFPYSWWDSNDTFSVLGISGFISIHLILFSAFEYYLGEKKKLSKKINIYTFIFSIVYLLLCILYFYLNTYEPSNARAAIGYGLQMMLFLSFTLYLWLLIIFKLLFSKFSKNIFIFFDKCFKTALYGTIIVLFLVLSQYFTHGKYINFSIFSNENILIFYEYKDCSKLADNIEKKQCYMNLINEDKFDNLPYNSNAGDQILSVIGIQSGLYKSESCDIIIDVGEDNNYYNIKDDNFSFNDKFEVYSKNNITFDLSRPPTHLISLDSVKNDSFVLSEYILKGVEKTIFDCTNDYCLSNKMFEKCNKSAIYKISE